MTRVSATGTAAGQAMKAPTENPMAKYETMRVRAVGIATSTAVTPEMAAANAPLVEAMHKALRDAQDRGVKDPLDLRRIVLDARDRHLGRK